MRSEVREGVRRPERGGTNERRNTHRSLEWLVLSASVREVAGSSDADLVAVQWVGDSFTSEIKFIRIFSSFN